MKGVEKEGHVGVDQKRKGRKERVKSNGRKRDVKYIIK